MFTKSFPSRNRQIQQLKYHLIVKRFYSNAVRLFQSFHKNQTFTQILSCSNNIEMKWNIWQVQYPNYCFYSLRNIYWLKYNGKKWKWWADAMTNEAMFSSISPAAQLRWIALPYLQIFMSLTVKGRLNASMWVFCSHIQLASNGK